jgi:hypothetical protein
MRSSAGDLEKAAQTVAIFSFLSLPSVLHVYIIVSSLLSATPASVLCEGRSTIKKNYILYTYFYIFSYFKNIFKKILIRSVLPVQPFL